jgi:phenylpropionate dioxygenase-like ring-hydroxylating dioxygenase large terminal subunit
VQPLTGRVWAGDPYQADPAAIPDLWPMNDPGWAGDGSRMPVAANFQLVLDTLMDLTHEEFVHAGSIGNPELSHSEFTVTHSGNSVTLTRWMLSIEPTPFLLKNLRIKFPGFAGQVDRWQVVRFQAPSTITIDGGAAEAGTGAPEGDRSRGITFGILNTVTPVHATSSDYFWTVTRDFAVHDQSLTVAIRDATGRIFDQDKEILTAQQDAIRRNPDSGTHRCRHLVPPPGRRLLPPDPGRQLDRGKQRSRPDR